MKAPRNYLPGLDSFRVFLVVLGAPIHMYIYSTKPDPLFAWWTVRESGFVFYLLWAVHLFRMSAYMLLAGYFCARMLEKKSLKDFAKDRARRILIPFIFFYILVLPLFDGTMSYRYVQGDERTLFISNLNYVIDSYERMLHGTLFVYHLWFLPALLVFYALVCLGARFLRHKSIRIAPNHAGLAALLWLGLLTFTCAVTSSTLNHWSKIPMAPTILSYPLGLFYYFPFFLTGLLLFTSPEIARVFVKNFKWLLLTAFVLLGFIAYAVRDQHLLSEGFSPGLRTIVAIIAACLSIGFFGLFESVVRKPVSWVLTLSPASYWFYLWHPFVTVIVISVLRKAHLGISNEVVLGSGFVIFLTYGFFFLWDFAKHRTKALYGRSEALLAERY
jgi:glucan biosynthesis protein C